MKTMQACGTLLVVNTVLMLHTDKFYASFHPPEIAFVTEFMVPFFNPKGN